jgi:hypothetical protein
MTRIVGHFEEVNHNELALIVRPARAKSRVTTSITRTPPDHTHRLIQYFRTIWVEPEGMMENRDISLNGSHNRTCQINQTLLDAVRSAAIWSEPPRGEGRLLL